MTLKHTPDIIEVRKNTGKRTFGKGISIYLIDEAEYNALQKAKRNAEYMEKINESVENHKKGDTISFTMEELRAMESEDWKPNDKILEFEKSHTIELSELR